MDTQNINPQENSEGLRLLELAADAWNAGSTFRETRRRCLDYTFGRQWLDPIMHEGRYITEYEYLLHEGAIPLQNNLIRRLVRNVLGVFRRQFNERFKPQGPLLEISKENRLPELYSRTFEEFLVSGMAIHRKRLGLNDGKTGIWTDNIPPRSFFYNKEAQDPRGCDLSLLGVYHVIGFDDWCRNFVNSAQDMERARRLFSHPGKRVRVTEIWRREQSERWLVHDREAGLLRRCLEKPSSNIPSLWTMKEVWRYYFITDNGTILKQGDSPYLHGRHPFVIKCYPFLDGEIHSFVGDIIDQQRYTNRLITLYDWVIRASAKGVLLIPKGSMDPDELEDAANTWARFDGVIEYNAYNGMPAPQQVSGNNTHLGISELLEIQLKMLEDVSGVNAALQGKLSSGLMSGTLYSQQTENAITSLSDLLESYFSFIDECSTLDTLILQQSQLR